MAAPSINQDRESFKSPKRSNQNYSCEHQADHLLSYKIHKNYVRNKITYEPVDRELLLKLPGLLLNAQQIKEHPLNLHSMISSAQQSQNQRQINISPNPHPCSVHSEIPYMQQYQTPSPINISPHHHTSSVHLMVPYVEKPDSPRKIQNCQHQLPSNTHPVIPLVHAEPPSVYSATLYSRQPQIPGRGQRSSIIHPVIPAVRLLQNLRPINIPQHQRRPLFFNMYMAGYSQIEKRHKRSSKMGMQSLNRVRRRCYTTPVKQFQFQKQTFPIPDRIQLKIKIKINPHCERGQS